MGSVMAISEVQIMALASIISFAAIFIVDPGGKMVNYALLAIINLVLIGAAGQINSPT